MMLHIYGGMRGAAKYGLDADVLLEEALLDGFRVWIDPDGWYRGDPIGKCAWSGWKAKPVDVRPEAWEYAGAASRPVILVNPECRDGKHDNCDGNAWDTRTDAVTDCPCTCHEPKENDFA